MWQDSKYVALDLETSGELPEYALQPWRVKQGKAWITSVVAVEKIPAGLNVMGQLTVGVSQAGVTSILRAILQSCIDKQQTLVGWNISFDVSWLYAYGCDDLITKLKFLDGMLLWRHLEIEPEYDLDKNKKKPYGLKLAVTQYIPGSAGYEEDVDFHSTNPAELKKLHEYNLRDTCFTLALTRKFYAALEADPQRLKAAIIEAEAIPLVAQANLDGMHVAVETTEQLGNKLVQVANDMLLRLEPHGVTEKVVRSPKQLATLMFEQWGLPVLKQNVSNKTGNVSNSTDKEVLHELSFIDPRAAEIRAYREALGNKTKFVDAPLESVKYNGDDCTHPLAMVFGTYTSRMTYASKQGKNKDERQIGFALHQMKRGKDFRAIIEPPDGYTLMEFDAAGQEFRWMAIASEDPTMLELCMPGGDPHSYMGAEIAHCDYHELIQAVEREEKAAKDSRQLGKVANLSCIAEGTIITTLRGDVPIEEVLLRDLIWDGVEFVQHAGVICNGEREVIYYAGLEATPEHQVLVGGEWVNFIQAATQGLFIDRGAYDGVARKGDSQRNAHSELAGEDTSTYPLDAVKPLYGAVYKTTSQQGFFRRRHYSIRARERESEIQRLEEISRTVRVFDILNCGPRNRFVANGLIVHNCQYRTSAKKLRVVARVQYNIPMDMPEATRIHATYQNTYKGVPRYWDRQIALTKRLGYVETFAGRRVQVIGNWGGNQGWAMGSTAINYRIQGTGGDQKYLALAVLRPYLPKIGAKFAWELHDGIYLYVPNNMVKRAAVEIKYLLDNLPYKKAWGFTPPIPLPFDCKTGPSWGALKGYVYE